MIAASAFEPAEAVQLLDTWAGTIDLSTSALTERLGRLPLALRIIGALMSVGMTGSNLFHYIQQAPSPFRIFRPPSVSARTVASAQSTLIAVTNVVLFLVAVDASVTACKDPLC